MNVKTKLGGVDLVPYLLILHARTSLCTPSFFMVTMRTSVFLGVIESWVVHMQPYMIGERRTYNIPSMG